MKMPQTEKVKERITDFLLVGILLVVSGFIGANTGRLGVVWGFVFFFVLTRWPRGVRRIVKWHLSWVWYAFGLVVGGIAVPEWVDWASGRTEFQIDDFNTWGGIFGIALVIFYGLLLLLIHRGRSGRKETDPDLVSASERVGDG